MKVIIYGNSNLAHYLKQSCKQRNYEYAQRSRSFSTYTSGFHLSNRDPDFIINTVGGKISDDSDTLWGINITLNRELQNEYPKTKIIAFSSNSALEPWRSKYGSIKQSLETLAVESKNLCVIRVSSLYASFKADRCFPWKLKYKNSTPRTVLLPTNPVQPTPCKWLAEEIFERILTFNHGAIYSICPSDFCTTAEWGRWVLGPDYTVIERKNDPDRNILGRLNADYSTPTCLELWNEYKNS